MSTEYKNCIAIELKIAWNFDFKQNIKLKIGLHFKHARATYYLSHCKMILSMTLMAIVLLGVCTSDHLSGTTKLS